MREVVRLCTLLSLLVPSGMAQWASIRGAPEHNIPTRVDGNSPSLWLNNRFVFFTSTGAPVRLIGDDQFSLRGLRDLTIVQRDHLPLWMESVWLSPNGAIYGWYHNEPGGVCPGSGLTAPSIGAAVSYDGGRTFYDLGLVLTSGDPVDCSAQNGFFAGGHGDFSVILDRERKYFYFLFTSYGGNVSGQGVALARMAYENRSSPLGTVFKYFNGGFTEPGVGGRLTPVFPATVAWQRKDADSFWGAAVHWNTKLSSYVTLLNRSCCDTGWPQEGIYVSFNPDIANANGWSKPRKIISDVGFNPYYYPLAIGLGPGETDTLVGETARFYLMGRSYWEITFHTADEPEPQPIIPDNPPPPSDAPLTPVDTLRIIRRR